MIVINIKQVAHTMIDVVKSKLSPQIAIIISTKWLLLLFDLVHIWPRFGLSSQDQADWSLVVDHDRASWS